MMEPASELGSRLCSALGTSPAIISAGGRLERGELEACVARFADAIAGWIGPGAVVGLIAEEPLDLIVQVLAVNSLEAHCFFVHPEAPSPEVAAVIAEERAQVIIGRRPWPGASRSYRVPCRDRMMDVSLLVDQRGPASCASRASVHLYSSGSSGQRKGIIRGEAALVAEGKGIAQMLGLDSDTTLLCPVPLYHAYGFGMGLLAALASGATLVLESPRSPRTFRACVERYEPQLLVAVPVLYELWSRGSGHGIDDRCLTRCISSGGPLSAKVATAFEVSWHRSIATQYGMSECGPIAIDLDEDSGAACMGRPYPGVRIALEPRAGSAEGVGEIVVESPYAGSGYVSDDPSESGRLNSQWSRLGTGDLGCLDEVGRLYLRGRLSSQINVHGQKVDPFELEGIIVAHPDVHDVAVVGAPRVTGGEFVVAFVVGNEQLDESRVFSWCRDHLVHYKLPRCIIPVDALPRTVTGKIDREPLLRHPRLARVGDPDASAGMNDSNR